MRYIAVIFFSLIIYKTHFSYRGVSLEKPQNNITEFTQPEGSLGKPPTHLSPSEIREELEKKLEEFKNQKEEALREFSKLTGGKIEEPNKRNRSETLEEVKEKLEENGIDAESLFRDAKENLFLSVEKMIEEIEEKK